MDKSTIHADLEWLADKSSYKQIFNIFYTLATVRYATQKQLQSVNHRVATKNNLSKLVELGYLAEKNLTTFLAYHVTEKTRQVLKQNGYNADIIQKKFKGEVLQHELLITDCILKLQGKEDYFTTFYPIFREPPDYQKEFLRPDACVIWKKDNSYKIQFLEVEEPKDDWENYLLGKRDKYERLAEDANLFLIWWKVNSQRLGLPMCKIEDFCFSVLCFSKLKFDWEGWNFER